MAKIILISEHWTEPLSVLATSLKEQHHEITFLTGKDHGDKKIESDIEVMSYFKRWSALEALRLFPRLLSRNYDIWHFVFSDPKLEKPSTAHWTMAALAQSLPGKAVATTIYGSVLPVRNWAWKPFLRICDFVTLGTRESLMSFKRRGFLSRHMTSEVLPPLLEERSAPESSSQTDQLQRLVKALEPFLLVFSDRLPKSLKDPSTMAPYKLLFLGTRSESESLPHCYFISDNLTENEILFLMTASKSVLLAFADLSVLELVRIQNLCKKINTPVIANSQQIEICPGLCLHKRNGWVIPPEPFHLKTLLSENPRLNLPQIEDRPMVSNPVDHTMNELHRLYTKALNQKT